jgi:protein TonB
METYVAPQYPARARRRGITGMVDVRFIINADGSIGSLEVVDAERGEIFAASALEAVRQWRFEPRDEAISSRVTLRFDLDD